MAEAEPDWKAKAQEFNVAMLQATARVGALEVQVADLKRQLVTAMEQARAAEKKASRLGHELEQARAGKA